MIVLFFLPASTRCSFWRFGWDFCSQPLPPLPSCAYYISTAPRYRRHIRVRVRVHVRVRVRVHVREVCLILAIFWAHSGMGVPNQGWKVLIHSRDPVYIYIYIYTSEYIDNICTYHILNYWVNFKAEKSKKAKNSNFEHKKTKNTYKHTCIHTCRKPVPRHRAAPRAAWGHQRNQESKKPKIHIINTKRPNILQKHLILDTKRPNILQKT